MGFHINPRSYVLMYDVPPERISLAQRSQLLSIEQLKQRREEYKKIATDIIAEDEPLAYHELYHFWQGISWPYLFIFSSELWEFYRERRKQIKSMNDPISWPLGNEGLRSPWAKLYSTARISFKPPNGLNFEPVESDDGKRTLSNWRLLEGAASLFQYKVSAKGLGSPEGFVKWTDEHHAYLNAYNLMSDVLGEEFAFRGLVPLIAASFHTTEPINTFTFYLLELQKYDLDELLELQDSQLFETILKLIQKEIPRATNNHRDRISVGGGETIPRFLSQQIATDGPYIHPLLKPYRDRWRLLVEKEPELESLFVDPLQRGRQKLLMHEFRPPVSVFLLGDAPDMSLPPACAIFDESFGRQQGEVVLAFHSLLTTIDKIFDLPAPSVRRACPWQTCRYYETNLCEGHLNPPPVSSQAESNCSFPVLLRDMFNLTLGETFKLFKVQEG